ncbi:MAG: hypothetical protein CVU81_00715 [Euryarchaeota archaeon HGW-Euryarchaeota-1]|nr:MAG: hypothetical protein CVU81_00715 [Euryarchaeota archaeon HGW-Euryarchaeota-1]
MTPQIAIYETPDGTTKLQVKLEDETVWLTQKAMAELFEVSIPTINEHLRNIFSTQELEKNSVVRNFRRIMADEKIDEMVYELYGLSEKEVEVVKVGLK